MPDKAPTGSIKLPHILETNCCSDNFIYLQCFTKLNLVTDGTAGQSIKPDLLM